MWMNLLTDALPEGGIRATLGETALYALIGFAVVFMGIAFLIFVVWVVGLLMTKMTEVTKKKENKTQGEQIALPAPERSEEVDEEMVAVIMAALTAYYEKNNPKCEFTIKRIKKVRRNDYA